MINSSEPTNLYWVGWNRHFATRHKGHPKVPLGGGWERLSAFPNHPAGYRGSPNRARARLEPPNGRFCRPIGMGCAILARQFHRQLPFIFGKGLILPDDELRSSDEDFLIRQAPSEVFLRGGPPIGVVLHVFILSL